MRSPLRRKLLRLQKRLRRLRNGGERYGDDRTVHRTGEVNVELFRGQVVAVWFRCRTLPFTQHENGPGRAAEMKDAYRQSPPPIKAIVFEDGGSGS